MLGFQNSIITQGPKVQKAHSLKDTNKMENVTEKRNNKSMYKEQK